MGFHKRAQLSLVGSDRASLAVALALIRESGVFVELGKARFSGPGWRMHLTAFSLALGSRVERPIPARAHWYSRLNDALRRSIAARRNAIQTLDLELGPLAALPDARRRFEDEESVAAKIIAGAHDLQPLVTRLFLGPERVLDVGRIGWHGTAAFADGVLACELGREEVDRRILPAGLSVDGWSVDAQRVQLRIAPRAPPPIQEDS